MSEIDPAKIWIRQRPVSAEMRPEDRTWADDPTSFGGGAQPVEYLRADIVRARVHSQELMILALEEEVHALREQLDDLTNEVPVR